MLKSLILDEAGQGLAEYSLILLLVAIVVIATLAGVGTQISGMFNNIKSEFP